MKNKENNINNANNDNNNNHNEEKNENYSEDFKSITVNYSLSDIKNNNEINTLLFLISLKL